MKRNRLLIAGIAVLSIILVQYNTGYGQEKIKWYTMEEVQDLSKENPKKVFVDVYTDWCGWCKKMDQTTFQDPKIVNLLNSDFYAVKFDGEGKENVKFKDKEYKFVPQGNRGYHELAAIMLNGKLSYPTTVYLDEQLNIIQPIPGYMTVESLEPILVFLGQNHYKNQSWEDFSKNFSNK